jgi:hypothetical protein
MSDTFKAPLEIEYDAGLDLNSIEQAIAHIQGVRRVKELDGDATIEATVAATDDLMFPHAYELAGGFDIPATAPSPKAVLCGRHAREREDE